MCIGETPYVRGNDGNLRVDSDMPREYSWLPSPLSKDKYYSTLIWQQPHLASWHSAPWYSQQFALYVDLTTWSLTVLESLHVARYRICSVLGSPEFKSPHNVSEMGRGLKLA